MVGPGRSSTARISKTRGELRCRSSSGGAQEPGEPRRHALVRHHDRELQREGIGSRSFSVSIDTTTPGGKLVLHIFGAVVEFERDLIKERTAAGLDWASPGNTSFGRWPGIPVLPSFEFAARTARRGVRAAQEGKERRALGHERLDPSACLPSLSQYGPGHVALAPLESIRLTWGPRRGSADQFRRTPAMSYPSQSKGICRGDRHWPLRPTAVHEQAFGL